MSHPPRVLVVFHSRHGSTERLCDSAVAGARSAVDHDVEVRVRSAFDAGPDDVTWCEGLLMATPARFGYMSGALKDFLERIYHPSIDAALRLPYALVVKGDSDVDGARSSVERIVTGLGWRLVLPPLLVVGDIVPAHLDLAAELGAALCAGLDAGIF